MNLCKDCAYCRPYEDRFFGLITIRRDYRVAKCARVRDPVTGEPKEFCSVERMGVGSCGPDGKHYIPPKGSSYCAD